jgi:hypothetical protein
LARSSRDGSPGRGRRSRHLHQAIGLAGVVSLGAALGVHFGVAYTDLWHLAPALVAAACLVTGLVLEHPRIEPGPVDAAELRGERPRPSARSPR